MTPQPTWRQRLGCAAKTVLVAVVLFGALGWVFVFGWW